MEVLYRTCAGMDVHKDSIVVCVRSMKGSKIEREVQTFGTTTSELIKLGDSRRSLESGRRPRRPSSPRSVTT